LPPQSFTGQSLKTSGTQQAEAKGSTDANPRKQETQEKTEETETSNQEDEVPNQEEGNPEIVTPGKQVKGQAEIPSKGVGDIPFLTSSEPATECYLETIIQGN
jgi:hypothetical protein